MPYSAFKRFPSLQGKMRWQPPDGDEEVDEDAEEPSSSEASAASRGIMESDRVLGRLATCCEVKFFSILLLLEPFTRAHGP